MSKPVYLVFHYGGQLVPFPGVVVGQLRDPFETFHETDGAGQSALGAADTRGGHSGRGRRGCRRGRGRRGRRPHRAGRWRVRLSRRRRPASEFRRGPMPRESPETYFFNDRDCFIERSRARTRESLPGKATRPCPTFFFLRPRPPFFYEQFRAWMVHKKESDQTHKRKKKLTELASRT